MLEETIQKLAIAQQFAHNSQYAGVARQAVADGYSAVDAVFTAILIQDGVTPPRNHKAKLDRVKEQHPNLFDARIEQFGNGMSHMPEIVWEDIERYYSEWLVSRYEAFEMPPGDVRKRVGTTLIALSYATRYLANAMPYQLGYSDIQALLWPYYFYSRASNTLVFQVILAGTR